MTAIVTDTDWAWSMADVTALSIPRCCAGDAVATQDRRFGLLCAMSRYRPKPDEHSEKPGT